MHVDPERKPEREPTVRLVSGRRLEEARDARDERGGPAGTEGGRRIAREPAAERAPELAEDAGGGDDEHHRNHDQQHEHERCAHSASVRTAALPDSPSPHVPAIRDSLAASNRGEWDAAMRINGPMPPEIDTSGDRGEWSGIARGQPLRP